MAKILSVTMVNQHIKSLMDRDDILTRLAVEGEISNYKAYPSGHHYFSLKDKESSIRCVMFKGEARNLRFRPENGMAVILTGRVTAFPRDGQYQMYVTAMMPQGLGDLHVAFSQMKEKLEKEGLFDPSHKKALPDYPERIALVTSPAGAAVRDMIRVLGTRYPLAKILVVPVLVQGEGAAFQIASAIDYVNRLHLADLIITGRGGGSMEDLWAFNEEIVARAIFASEIPIISAVGHEPDVSISDYVADMRGATPSNGAELAVPHGEDLQRHLARNRKAMVHALEQKVSRGERILERARRSPWLRYPFPAITEKRALLEYNQQKIHHELEKTLRVECGKLSALAASLDALSPLKVLARGYALAEDDKGERVDSIEHISLGEALHVRVEDGKLYCRVEGKMKNGDKT